MDLNLNRRSGECVREARRRRAFDKLGPARWAKIQRYVEDFRMGDAQTPAHLCTRTYTQLVGTEKGMLATLLSTVVPVCEVNLAKFRSLSRFLPLFTGISLEKQLDLGEIKICSHQNCSRSSFGGKSSNVVMELSMLWSRLIATLGVTSNRSNISTSKIKRDGDVLLARSKTPPIGWLALHTSIYFTPDVFFKGIAKQRDASAAS